MGLFRRSRRNRFFALRNVSLRVEPGQSMAIVGHNGAGKSTVLSLAAGLTAPDEGAVAVRGRVAALLELGSGFHPDLTGKENIWINGALMGLSREEVRRRYNGIVEFADIGDFLEEPIRTYSAGMIMRLAFAVAVNVDPDILIVDEVLGVGDQAFFKKCVHKIMEFRRKGNTLLCVSHSTETLRELCDSAVWLDHGEVVHRGPIDDVLAEYHASVRPLSGSSR